TITYRTPPLSVSEPLTKSFLWHLRAQPSTRVVFGSRKLRLAPRPSARVFSCSRKLRLAPQGYSPWTPPTDRLLVRSYPPASRHPQPSVLVARPSRADAGLALHSVPYVSGPTGSMSS